MCLTAEEGKETVDGGAGGPLPPTAVPPAVSGSLGRMLLSLGQPPSQNPKHWNIPGLYDLCCWVMLEP